MSLRPERNGHPAPIAGAGNLFAGVKYVLTDMDDTLTHAGRLPAAAYTALARLEAAGIKVVPVTAAPAGWCDQMARMWPVDAVIGENGGFFFHRDSDGRDLSRRYWLEADALAAAAERLAVLGRDLIRKGQAKLAGDQPFRQTSLAFDRPADPAMITAIADRFLDAGARHTVNSLWLLGWFGDYDKLVMARRLFAERYGLQLDEVRDQVVYVGDSLNDAPMFNHFPHSIGVSTVTDYLEQLPKAPAWITQGPGGDGFVEAANAILNAHKTGETA